MFDTAGRATKGEDLLFGHYVGIDWGTQKHRACLMSHDGKVVDERWIEHGGQGLAELVAWLRKTTSSAPSEVAVAIEVPRGAIVETLMENSFPVFSINPKQLDRFRDRYSPAGAKDDRRDAFVLADSLRTDIHCFHAVRQDDPVVIRLRDLSRLDDDIGDEQNRLNNQFREQLFRFFPQLLKLSPSADELWLWELFQMAPLPAKAAKLSETKIARVLRDHRIRRLDAAQVGIFKVLAERGFTRQLGNCLHLQTTPGAAHPVVLHMHYCLILAPRQIPHFPLADLLDLVRSTAAPGTNQHFVPAFAPHPKPERSRCFVNLVPVNPIPRPVQYFREFAVRQSREFNSPLHIPAQSHTNLQIV